MSKVIGRALENVMRKSIVGLVLCLMATGLAAQNVQIREDRPDTYVVVRGDTLWDISGNFLENPAAWPQIWRVNPQIENPDLIYPGDIVALRYIDGQPVLELQRGDRTEAAVVRLSPAVRRGPLGGGFGEIRLEDIASFLSQNLVVDEEDLADYGYILGTQSERILASDGDVVFARGDWNPDMSNYAVVRPRRTFMHPESGEVIGVELDHIGTANIMSLNDENDVATIRIQDVTQEIRKTDLVIQQDRYPAELTYRPTVPETDIDEYVLGFSNGMERGGTSDSIIMSGGEDTGVQIGDLLTVRRADQMLEDEVRGDIVTVAGERYATVMVYRVFEKASLALVLNSSGSMDVSDKVIAE